LKKGGRKKGKEIKERNEEFGDKKRIAESNSGL